MIEEEIKKILDADISIKEINSSAQLGTLYAAVHIQRLQKLVLLLAHELDKKKNKEPIIK
jgi:hypothetical protein